MLQQPLILLMGLVQLLSLLLPVQHGGGGGVEAFHLEPKPQQQQASSSFRGRLPDGTNTKKTTRRRTSVLSRQEMILSGNNNINNLSEFLEEHENSSSNNNDDNDKQQGFHRSHNRRTPRRKQNAAANGGGKNNNKNKKPPTKLELELMQRILQLEELAATQQGQIQTLNDQLTSWGDTLENFSYVMKRMRESAKKDQQDNVAAAPPPPPPSTPQQSGTASSETSLSSPAKDDGTKSPTGTPAANNKSSLLLSAASVESTNMAAAAGGENFDGIFATAPATVMDAADAAGAAILAGLLAGKQRMLVDVRDAELTRSPETWSQFIELAILPVAAGLEGLRSQRNRLKLCFATLAHLLQYRKTMTLCAPDVVALSTLGFDPVAEKDNLVVIVAPAPDDDEGLAAMNKLLSSTSLNQPVVVLNHHMVPIAGPSPVDDFEVAYHLRLFSVQYAVGGDPYMQDDDNDDDEEEGEMMIDDSLPTNNATALEAALEAAMQHAHETGRHSGVTRAMVIRAYPRPWHVFVDTSPDTDADFSVAATFDTVPTTDQINNAIVECLEGSEEEDDLVKQQMQEALESGQLDRVEDMLWSIGLDTLDDDDEEEDDDDDIYRDMFGEDSV
jgi:uncharacterized coiled-coil protein SlyX